jgi:hypothetical protein
VLHASNSVPSPRRFCRDAQPDEVKHRLRDHGTYLCLATAALAAVVLIGLAGCQTPPQTAAPVYGSTVAPPATGMIGQPAAYGGYATTPPTVSYAPAAGGQPMPGPSTSWQGVAQPAAPAANTWSWSQPSAPAQPAPTMQQYGSQLSNQANQYQQSLSNQANQYANQTQQALNNQAQQYGNQMQNTANQYQQGFNNQMQQYNNQMQQGMQSAQQQMNAQFQQANTQMQQAMPQMTGPQQQTTNGSWWPFSNPSGMPPARATPAMPTRY